MLESSGHPVDPEAAKAGNVVMALQIADHWFETRRIDDAITLIYEPHVDPFIRCNIWHVRGRDRDLLIDTGLGICSLAEFANDILDKRVCAVATHYHYDHTGSMSEFDERIIHRREAALMAGGEKFAELRTAAFGEDFVSKMTDAGYDLPALLITALPRAGYDVDAYGIEGAAPTRTVEAGDAIEIGDRAFEIVDLPGHSPGSMGLWEAATGTLFSGDALYDGPLLDELEDSDIAIYIETIRTLRDLPVSVVHAGHEPSFGRARMIELCDAYLAKRAA